MSLGRLLSSGKSLVGLQSVSRYELRKGALPKFNSSKNPFAVKPQPEAAEQELSSAEMAAAHLKKTQRLPLLTPKPEASSETFPVAQPGEGGQQPPKSESPSLQPPSVAPAAAPVTINSWLKKLNPLVWFHHDLPAEAKGPIPHSSRTPVQGELSLDNIKVMRNDLNDADVEVVPMKLNGSAAAMAIPELPPATNAWEFLGERLLRNH